MNLAEKLVGVLILTVFLSPVWGMEEKEIDGRDQPGAGPVNAEIQVLNPSFEKLKQEHIEEIASVRAEIASVRAEFDEKLAAAQQQNEEKFQSYQDSVAAVVNGQDPVFYQEITANKLLLGIGVCSAVGFISNCYYAYCETGSPFFSVLRASKESLKDFVTYYYGAKILEQAGALTTKMMSMASRNRGKKER